MKVIAVRLATHHAAIEEYVQKTLLYFTMNRAELATMLASTLAELEASNLVSIDAFGSFEATLLSKATVASYLAPEDGLFVHDKLRRAIRAFVMDGERHVYYTFTPISHSGTTEINWPVFRREMESLDESGLRVLELVGVSPSLINRM